MCAPRGKVVVAEKELDVWKGFRTGRYCAVYEAKGCHYALSAIGDIAFEVVTQIYDVELVDTVSKRIS